MNEELRQAILALYPTIKKLFGPYDAPDNLQVLSRAENARKGALGNTYTLGI